MSSCARCNERGDEVVHIEGGAQPSSLSPHERQLLEALAQAPGRTISRQQLGSMLGGGSILDGVLHRLRQKLEPDPKHPRILLTEHGEGVRLEARGAEGEGADEIMLACGRVSFAERWIERESGRVSLTSKETRLLRYLAAHPGRIISPEDLLAAVWQTRATQTLTVKTTIWRLRRKIERDQGAPEHLLTVCGGYRFEPLPSPQIPVCSPPLLFVGRAEELASLRTLVAGGAREIQIVGPPGSGKSALLHQLSAELMARGLDNFMIIDERTGEDLERARSEGHGVRLIAVREPISDLPQRLRLGPLSLPEAERLFYSLTDESLPPEGLLAKTDGMPGRIVALARGDEGSCAQMSAALSSVRAGLSREARHALDALAVLPGPSEDELARAVLPLTARSAAETLESLYFAGLIERDPSDRWWVTAAVRAICGSRRRAEVSARHAAWVLSRLGDGPIEAHDLDAAFEHLLERGSSDEAMRVFRSSRELLWSRSEHEAIIAGASRLIRCVTEPILLAELLWMRAGSYHWLGRWELSMADVEAGIEEADRAGDTTRVVALLASGSAIASGLGRDARAIEMTDLAARLVTPKDDILQALVADARSRCALYSNRLDEARDISLEALWKLEGAIRCGRLIGDSERAIHQRWALLVGLGLAHRELGQGAVAMANLREAERLHAATRDADLQRWSKIHIAATLADLGQFAESESMNTALLGGECSERREDTVMILFNRGVARAIEGRLSEAEADLLHAQHMGIRPHAVNQVIYGQVLLALAAVSARLGHIDRAEELLREGCSILPLAEQDYLALREVALGCIAVSLGQREVALVRLDTANQQTKRPFWRVLAAALSEGEAKNL